MSNWQWIIVLAIAVVGAIFIPKDYESYKDYNCYDKPFISAENAGNDVNGTT